MAYEAFCSMFTTFQHAWHFGITIKIDLHNSSGNSPLLQNAFVILVSFLVPLSPAASIISIAKFFYFLAFVNINRIALANDNNSATKRPFSHSSFAPLCLSFISLLVSRIFPCLYLFLFFFHLCLHPLLLSFIDFSWMLPLLLASCKLFPTCNYILIVS